MPVHAWPLPAPCLQVVKSADVIFIAVKPQYVSVVLREVRRPCPIILLALFFHPLLRGATGATAAAACMLPPVIHTCRGCSVE